MKKIFLGIFYLLIISEFLFAVDKFQLKREEMVNYQIKNRGVRDINVLNSMLEVPRHLFVPESYIDNAYEDRALPINYGQTISQPYIVALMTELLNPGKDSRILEIGTGSGYQAAVLSNIVKEVYTIEIYEELYKEASERLIRLNYKNIFTFNGDGYYGFEKSSPFDGIIVTCAADFIPPPLIKQLKIGGIMVIPVGPPFTVQRLIVLKKKSNKKIQTEIITDVIFVPLIRNVSN